MNRYQNRPYIEKLAFELEKGCRIWVTTENGPQLWTVIRTQHDRMTNFVNVECNKGGIIFAADSGVMVDLG